MPQHKTLMELRAGLPNVLASPQENGQVKAIVIRPQKGKRLDVDACDVSSEGGVHGDHWARGCWKSTEDGRPHPDVQVCIMNSRCIELIAGERRNWLPAGDNLFVDMDLRPTNLPPGQRVAVGDAIIEITDTPHNGCASFAERYGRDATIFVNTGDGKVNRLRGIYARVVKCGKITVGDRFIKTDA
ncbi:MAG: MOSC domain-containing protein [Hyphomicrobiaceae bacterium]